MITLQLLVVPARWWQPLDSLPGVGMPPRMHVPAFVTHPCASPAGHLPNPTCFAMYSAAVLPHHLQRQRRSRRSTLHAVAMWTRPTPDRNEDWVKPSYVPQPNQQPIIQPWRQDEGKPLYAPSGPEFAPAELPEKTKEMPEGPTMPGACMHGCRVSGCAHLSALLPCRAGNLMFCERLPCGLRAASGGQQRALSRTALLWRGSSIAGWHLIAANPLAPAVLVASSFTSS